MTVEQFKLLRRTRPFQPFAIHVADGRSFPVFHPDAAALSKSGRTVSVLNRDGLIEVIDMLLVASLRPLTDWERVRRFGGAGDKH